MYCELPESTGGYVYVRSVEVEGKKIERNNARAVANRGKKIGSVVRVGSS